MFARLFAVASFVALVVAGPLAARDGQCNTGNMYCCDSSQHSTTTLSQLFSGIPVGIAGTVLPSLGCNEIGLANVGGSTCSQDPMCCSNNEANGLIVLQCSPVTV